MIPGGLSVRRFVCLLVASALTAAGCGESREGTSSTREAEPVVRTFGLSDFQRFPEDAAWTETSDGFRTSGEPKGYVYSAEEIGPGVLTYEYRYPPGEDGSHVEDPNTGLLLFIQPPHKTWPACVEVQGKQSEAGQVKANGGMEPPDVLHDEAALAEAPKPPGEWNRVEVSISDDGLSATLNGVRTASAVCPAGTTGAFGLQAERNPVEFRNVRFMPRAAEGE